MKLMSVTLGIAAVITVVACARAQSPMGTGFTYQGQLKQGGQAADGSYNLVFTLWDAPGSGNPPVGGIQIGGADNEPGTSIADGLFTVQLNDVGQFGVNAFNGDARWVQVSVNGAVLGPRQPLTAAPYALFALDGPGQAGFWAANGTAISNTNTGFVGIRRSTPVTGAEYFGIQAPVASGYGGMYIRTDGNAGLPFYGYRSGTSGEAAWTYLDGASGDWRVNVDGDRMTVTDAGSVGIGTTSPQAKLHVTGDVLATGSLRSLSPLGDSEVFLGWGTDENGDDMARIRIGGNGIGASNGLDIQKVNNVSIMRIQNSGRVGIGNPVPVARLDVVGAGTQPAIQGVGHWGVYGVTTQPNQYGGVFACSDGIFGTGRALLVGGDAEVVDSLLVGNALVPAAAKLHVVNGSDSAPASGGFVVVGDTTGANISMDNNEIMARSAGQPSTLYLNNEGGDVRIGQNGTAPCTVYVPVLAITGADVAEKFPTSDEREAIEPGMVMEIDPANTGKLRVARGAYNRRVAGVVSGAGDIPVGAILGNLPGHEDAPAIALSGRVWVRCDAAHDDIQPGDLLTTSDTAGQAMKVTDLAQAQGAIIGKAMSSLSRGESGLVLVLVNLQ